MALDLSIIFFVSYIIAGLTISLLVFWWALKHGQFKDQERARYLALGNDPEPLNRTKSRSGPFEAHVLFFLVAAGLFTLGAVLFFSFRH